MDDENKKVGQDNEEVKSDTPIMPKTMEGTDNGVVAKEVPVEEKNESIKENVHEEEPKDENKDVEFSKTVQINETAGEDISQAESGGQMSEESVNSESQTDFETTNGDNDDPAFVMADEVQEQKKNKKTSAVIIAIILVCVIVAVVGAMGGAKGKVKSALANTTKEMAERVTVIDKSATDNISAMVSEGAANITMKAEAIKYPYNENLEGMGINADMNIDAVNKKADGTLGITYKGVSVLDINGYTDNNIIMTMVPNLYDKWFRFEADNVMKQYAESPLGSDAEYDESTEMSLKLFPDENEVSMLDVTQYTEAGLEIEKIFSDSFKNISKDIKYTKQSGKTDIIAGDVTKSCAGYEVIIPGEQVKSMIKEIATNVNENEQIKTAIESYTEAKFNTEYQYRYYYTNSDEMVNEIYTGIEDFIENLDNVEFSDCNIILYVNKKVIIDHKATLDITIDGDMLKIETMGGLKGNNKPSDVMDFSINFSDEQGNESLSLGYNDSLTIENDTVHSNIVIKLGETGNELKFILDNNYNDDEDTLIGTFRLVADEYNEMVLSYDGTLAINNDSLKAAFDNVTLSQNDNEMMNFSIEYGVVPFSGTIDEPVGEVIDIFKTDTETIQEIQNEIQGKLLGILMKIAG